MKFLSLSKELKFFIALTFALFLINNITLFKIAHDTYWFINKPFFLEKYAAIAKIERAGIIISGNNKVDWVKNKFWENKNNIDMMPASGLFIVLPK